MSKFFIQIIQDSVFLFFFNNRLRTIQLESDNKLNEVKSELKLKLFELERSNLLQEEHSNNLRKTLLENEKLCKKVEVLQNEYYALQIQNEKNFNEIENELNEKSVKLKSYEKLEHEMDEVILQAAECE
jgi:progesterone-induced-blocking factor 1